MSSTNKKLSVIILTFNSERNIAACLESLMRESTLIKEIIVVDNHSKDNTVKLVKNSKLKTKLIVNARNLGFSKGVNIGVNKSSGNKILILNPDTIIFPGSLARLISCQEITDAGVVGGKAIKVNGDIHNTFVREPGILIGIFDFTNLRKIFPFDYFHKRHYYLEAEFPLNVKEVDAVSGAFMLIERSVFEKIGLFDENFFMYLEDVDFCIRAKLKGFKIMFCPSAIIIHEGGASSRNKDRINHQAWSDSRRYYFKKHSSKIGNMIIQPAFKLDDRITHIWQRIKSRS